MGKATTLSERNFIKEKSGLGWTSQQIAEELKLSVKTVSKWRQRLKKGVIYNHRWGDLLRDV